MTIEEAIQSANNGDTDAMRGLGDYYFREREFDSACEWYEKAAEKGDGIAMHQTCLTNQIRCARVPMLGNWDDAINYTDSIIKYVPIIINDKKLVEDLDINVTKEIQSLNMALYYKTTALINLRENDKVFDCIEQLNDMPQDEAIVNNILLLYYNNFFFSAYENKDFSTCTDILNKYELLIPNIEFINVISDDDYWLQERQYAVAVDMYVIFLAKGIGLTQNVNKAYDVLINAINKVSTDDAKNKLIARTNNFKQKMFGGYRYVE